VHFTIQYDKRHDESMVHLHVYIAGKVCGVLLMTLEQFATFRGSTERGEGARMTASFVRAPERPAVP
jgi:hypothetical protein